MSISQSQINYKHLIVPVFNFNSSWFSAPSHMQYLSTNTQSSLCIVKQINFLVKYFDTTYTTEQLKLFFQKYFLEKSKD